MSFTGYSSGVQETIVSFKISTLHLLLLITSLEFDKIFVAVFLYIFFPIKSVLCHALVSYTLQCLFSSLNYIPSMSPEMHFFWKITML